MAAPVTRQASTDRQETTRENRATPWRTWLTGALLSLLVTTLLSAVMVFCAEWVVRGELQPTIAFFLQPFRPGWTTVAVFALLALALDAMFGRAHHAQLLIGPFVLTLAWICSQKARYLGDPLYPTDFLYSRQIIELMPLLVRERPIAAVGIVIALLVVVSALVTGWFYWRQRARRLSLHGRLMRLAVAVPALAFFVSIMDYATFSWARDRLQIIPMMWDQKENYASNGFALAFAMNVPMAKVVEPAGYLPAAMMRIAGRPLKAASFPGEKPDVVVVMSESFWDPTRLPGVNISPDPMPFMRANASGAMFSPEFGGMTANVEFEALTGFSNAFLPYGSIPYQQYIRGPMPSLATFLRSAGYETTAMHPFGGWFWNRKPVYDDFGFETFLAEDRLPVLAKRGLLPSDAALTEQIIKRVESSRGPAFVFAVTLQGHGPYDASRYPDARITVNGLGNGAAGAVRAYAEGISDADASLKRLVEWAQGRKRPTVIAFFGDHLPPLGEAYVESGYMKEPVADRKAPLPDMKHQHETPLLVWSNRDGTVRGIGSVSPAFIPLYVLGAAGIGHPYYTGLLGEVRRQYEVVDRHMLLPVNGQPEFDWLRSERLPPLVDDLRLLQYDIMFGTNDGGAAFFPELYGTHSLITSGPGWGTPGPFPPPPFSQPLPYGFSTPTRL